MFLENYSEIKDCIIIDTETVTDASSGIPKLWELGVVIIHNVDIVESKEWMVSPTAKFDRLDLNYSQNHVSIESIKNSPKFIEVYSEVEKFLNENCIIGGHNVDYDLKIMNRELSLLDKPLIGKQKFDTIKLAKKVHPEWQKFNLDFLCNYYNLKIERRHRALDDAYATAEAFIKMRDHFILNQKKETLQIGLF